MKIGLEQVYEVIETDHAIVLTRAGTQVRGGQALARADHEHLVEYLGNYLAAREAGKPLREAHDIALQVATMPKVIKLS